MTRDKKRKPRIEEVKGLFAFWRYDLYPYVLGAEIDAMTDKGSVHAPSYSKSYADGWFTPIKIMPAKAGKALLTRIEQMRTEHAASRALLDAEWNKTLFDLLPEARSPERTYAGFPRKVDDKK